ncbi:S-layer homology domain-containing protein [Paenibacillus chondroitinus]|uniref:S-layer homology domain-containing protein n=1 Tax=Paenibacillus chondroitinus TaxID=59842 RepID=A0ABU6DF78_9BACL|nr:MULTISPECIES: S-layer homology domain-containing protein [Paenibacillus]MCY9659266.1 S-layer homology domain-containing protein [Paenibacillus anseongense]MEB4796399.1 S-layer homology domain-containing protein [Paenibacillus chondroitinus]
MILRQKLIGMLGMVICSGLVFGNSVLAETGKYQDVPDGYLYKNYIEELSAKKLVEGTADGQFSPDSPLTREQFAKLVVMVFGLPAVDGGMPFQDCHEAWSVPYILTAYKAGIIQGTSEENFSPKQYVRKQEAAVMLSRLYPGVVQQNEQDWAGGAVAFVRHDILPANLQSMLEDTQAPLTRGEAAALLSLSLHVKEQGKSGKPGTVSTNPNGAMKEPALILDPTQKKEVTVNVNAGQPLYIQAELKKHKTYELEAHGENQSSFNMELTNAEGKIVNQGNVSSMQVTAEADGIVYAKIRTEQQKGTITLKIAEVGLDSDHPIILKAGRFDQLFPIEEDLYFKAVASHDNPIMVQAKGAISYQLLQVSLSKSAPHYGDSYIYIHGKLVKLNPEPAAINMDFSITTRNGDPYTINCECVVKLTTPVSTAVSFQVMDGNSIDNAYAIGWGRSEWKTGYKGNSIAGVFYQLALEEGKDYTIEVSEQMKPVMIDKNYIEGSLIPPTYTTPELDNTVVVKKILTIFGPDGKEVFVDEKLTGPIPFKATQAGTYVVKLESDAKDRTTEIRVKSAN